MTSLLAAARTVSPARYADRVVDRLGALRDGLERGRDLEVSLAARERAVLPDALGDRLLLLASLLGEEPLFDYAHLPEIVLRVWWSHRPLGRHVDPYHRLGGPTPERLRALLVRHERTAICMGSRQRPARGQLLVISDTGRLYELQGLFSPPYMTSYPNRPGAHSLVSDLISDDSHPLPRPRALETWRRHWWLGSNELLPFVPERWIFEDLDDPCGPLARAVDDLEQVVETARQRYEDDARDRLEMLERRAERLTEQ